MVWLVIGGAQAGDCGERLTVAPMMTPLSAPLPYGGNVRFDHTLRCPETRGTSLALTIDAGAVPIWIYHTGWFLTLRQQFGLQIEPAARGTVPGGPYIAVRTGLTELFLGEVSVAVLLGTALGYRYESRSGLVLQLGAGAEAWIPTEPKVDLAGWPVLELRAGYAFGRPDARRAE